jgi:hypothetical protein
MAAFSQTGPGPAPGSPPCGAGPASACWGGAGPIPQGGTGGTSRSRPHPKRGGRRRARQPLRLDRPPLALKPQSQTTTRDLPRTPAPKPARRFAALRATGYAAARSFGAPVPTAIRAQSPQPAKPHDPPRSPAKTGETFCSAPRRGACRSPSPGAPLPIATGAVPRQRAPVPAICRECPRARGRRPGGGGAGLNLPNYPIPREALRSPANSREGAEDARDAEAAASNCPIIQSPARPCELPRTPASARRTPGRRRRRPQLTQLPNPPRGPAISCECPRGRGRRPGCGGAGVKLPNYPIPREALRSPANARERAEDAREAEAPASNYPITQLPNYPITRRPGARR